MVRIKTAIDTEGYTWEDKTPFQPTLSRDAMESAILKIQTIQEMCRPVTKNA